MLVDYDIVGCHITVVRSHRVRAFVSHRVRALMSHRVRPPQRHPQSQFPKQRLRQRAQQTQRMQRKLLQKLRKIKSLKTLPTPSPSQQHLLSGKICWQVAHRLIESLIDMPHANSVELILLARVLCRLGSPACVRARIAATFSK